MKNEEIIEMADKADEEADKVLNMKGEYHPNWHQVRDEIFAKLVAEREREACAKECWKQMGLLSTQAWTVNPYEQCIDAIRARGQA